MTELRQLTALDAQFLAIESDRNYGHVGGLAILDPSTAPGGELTIEDLKQLILDRLHLVDPFTQRLVSVPFSIDWPYWARDEHFDIGYHCREIALPAPGSHEQLLEQVGRDGQPEPARGLDDGRVVEPAPFLALDAYPNRRLGVEPTPFDDELSGLEHELTAFERRVSDDRRDRYDRLDALSAELVRRYREGEATVDGLLGS